MRKIAVISFVFLCSCSLKTYPPKGNYPKTPIVLTSEKSVDQVWDNIIDLFAQNGIPISLIDKSSGLIISVRTKMSWSRENRKTSEIIRKDAQTVIDYLYDPGSRKDVKPSSVSGIWNVRIKNMNGKTSVNVNINELQAFRYSYLRDGTAIEVPTTSFHPRTTGKFEQTIYDIIK